jgi:hypothetical protein
LNSSATKAPLPNLEACRYSIFTPNLLWAREMWTRYEFGHLKNCPDRSDQRLGVKSAYILTMLWSAA